MSKFESAGVLGLYLAVVLGSAVCVAWINTRWLWSIRRTWADLLKAPTLLGLAMALALGAHLYENALYGLVRWWPQVFGGWGANLWAAAAGKVMILLSLACVLSALSNVQTGAAHVAHVFAGLGLVWLIGAVVAYMR